jgi:hypothetical protein
VTWETPKNIAILAGVLIAATTAIAGFVGYKDRQEAPDPAGRHPIAVRHANPAARAMNARQIEPVHFFDERGSCV